MEMCGAEGGYEITVDLEGEPGSVWHEVDADYFRMAPGNRSTSTDSDSFSPIDVDFHDGVVLTPAGLVGASITAGGPAIYPPEDSDDRDHMTRIMALN